MTYQNIVINHNRMCDSKTFETGVGRDTHKPSRDRLINCMIRVFNILITLSHILWLTINYNGAMLSKTRSRSGMEP